MSEQILPGLNVQQPWAKLILSGEKTIETRYYRLPDKHVGRPIALIETPGANGKFRARIIGIIIFNSSFEYKSKSQFSADNRKHLVNADDKHLGWKKGRTKWGWPIARVVSFKSPILAPSPRGIVFCSHCKIPSKLLSAWLPEPLR